MKGNSRACTHSEDFEDGSGSEHFLRAAIGDQPAELEQKDAVERARHAQVVEADEERGAAVRESARQGHDLESVPHVQLGDGLVPELQSSPGRDRACKAHPLALAPAEPGHRPVRQISKVEGGQRIVDAAPVVGPHVAPLGDHFPDAEGELEARFLRHPGQASRPVDDGDARQRPSIQLDVAAGRQESRGRLEQCRLAASVRADDGCQGAVPQREGYSVQTARHRQRADRQSAHASVLSIQRKNGPPTSAVITPRRSPPGRRRVATSQASVRTAPPIIEAGRSLR